MVFLKNRFIIGLIFILSFLAIFKKIVYDEIDFLKGENAYLKSNLDSQHMYVTRLEEELLNLKKDSSEYEKRLVQLEAFEKERQKELLIPELAIKVYNSTEKGISVTLFVDNQEIGSEPGLNSGFWKTLGSFKVKQGSQIRLVAKLSASSETNELLATHTVSGTENTLRFIITLEGIKQVL